MGGMAKIKNNSSNKITRFVKNLLKGTVKILPIKLYRKLIG